MKYEGGGQNGRIIKNETKKKTFLYIVILYSVMDIKDRASANTEIEQDSFGPVRESHELNMQLCVQGQH